MRVYIHRRMYVDLSLQYVCVHMYVYVYVCVCMSVYHSTCMHMHSEIIYEKYTFACFLSPQ